MHDGRRAGVAIAVRVELVDQQTREIDPLLAMPLRILDLRVDSDAAPHRAVEPGDQSELLFECCDAKDRRFRREARWKTSVAAPGAAPLRDGELP